MTVKYVNFFKTNRLSKYGHCMTAVSASSNTIQPFTISSHAFPSSNEHKRVMFMAVISQPLNSQNTLAQPQFPPSYSVHNFFNTACYFISSVSCIH